LERTGKRSKRRHRWSTTQGDVTRGPKKGGRKSTSHEKDKTTRHREVRKNSGVNWPEMTKKNQVHHSKNSPNRRKGAMSKRQWGADESCISSQER